MKTFGQILDESKGLGKGFDFLRIALSVAVASYHIVQIATGTKAFTGPVGVAVYGILIMFFGLSGFLIAASAQRLSLKNFLINRGLRIFPALAVEVILSAFVLGPIFTTYGLHDYFTDRKFYYYLSNLFGAAYLFLPGVFGHEFVNGSIWTVPWEMACYVIISAFIYFGLMRKGWIIVVLAAALAAAQAVYYISGAKIEFPIAHGIMDYMRSIGPRFALNILYDGGSRLLVSFMIGIAMYLFRYRIAYSPMLCVACLIVAFGGSAIGTFGSDGSAGENFFLVPAFLYLTIFFGLTPLPLPKLLHRGDYSYGVYLYSYPLTMTMYSSFPEHSKNWIFLWCVSIPLAGIFAAFSWHFIERPILQLRKRFSFVAKQRLEAEAGDSGEISAAPKSHIVARQT